MRRRTLFDSLVRSAAMVSDDIGVVVAAVTVEVSNGQLIFGADEVARRATDWMS